MNLAINEEFVESQREVVCCRISICGFIFLVRGGGRRTTMIIIITFIVGIIEWHIIYDSWFIVTCGIVKPFDTSIIWLSSTNTVAWHVLNWRKKNKEKWDQICINNSTSIKLYTAYLLPGPLSPSLTPHHSQFMVHQTTQSIEEERCVWFGLCGT